MAVKAAWFSSVMLETMPIRSGTEEGTWSGMPKASEWAEQERGVLHTAEMATNTRQWWQNECTNKTASLGHVMTGLLEARVAGAGLCHNAHAQKPENGMDVAHLPD